MRPYTALRRTSAACARGRPLSAEGMGWSRERVKKGGVAECRRPILACSADPYSRQHDQHPLSDSGRRELGYGPEERMRHAANGQNETLVDPLDWGPATVELEPGLPWRMREAKCAWRGKTVDRSHPTRIKQRRPQQQELKNDMIHTSDGLHGYAPGALVEKARRVQVKVSWASSAYGSPTTRETLWYRTGTA